MAKHIDKDFNETEFNETVKAHIEHTLKERQDYGIAQGMYALAMLFRDIGSNEEETVEARLTSILNHCKSIIESARKSDRAGEKT